MALGLGWLTLSGADTFAYIDAVAAAGFDFLTLPLIQADPNDLYMPLVGDPALTGEVRRRLEAHGLQAFDVERCRLSAETDVRALQPHLALAAELGARQLLVVPVDENRARLEINLAALCDLAADAGMSVALEFMQFRAVKTLEDAERVVRAVGRPNFGIVLDALHLARSGGTPAMVRALDPALIAYLQICDASAEVPPTIADVQREARGGRLLPGQGVLPLNELLDALPADIVITVEAPCAAFAGMPPLRQAQLVADATRTFLAARG